MTRVVAGDQVPFLSLRNARDCVLGALGVFALCMIGQEFYKVSGTLAAPLWPSSGFALALLLLGGWRLFPAVSLGTIAATQAFGDAPLFSIAGSLGNTLESLSGWYLMTRVFDFSNSMTRLRDVALLVLAGAPWGTMLSALICTMGLVGIGVVMPGNIPLSGLLFWTGNVLGILVFSPVVLRLATLVGKETRPRFESEDLFWTLLLVIVVVTGFSLKGVAHTGLIAIGYFSFPILVWLALLWRKNVTIPLALVTVLMTAFTATGHGPLVRTDPWATYAEMTVFIAVYVLSCLVIMAAVEELDHQAALAAENRILAAKKETELQAIRSHLNPHFLFNSLNVIKSLVSEDPEKAKSAVVALSDLLRSSLDATGRESVSLREELSVIGSYLDLQALRMEQLLVPTWEIPEVLKEALIPPMLLHQMVENALKHSPPDRIALRITARCTDQTLELGVSNPGTLPPDFSPGIGLRAIRLHLETLYGTSGTFSLTESSGMINAVMRIPMRPERFPVA